MKKTVLLVTDFSYEAKGREYFREDVELSILLRKYFRICIGHISDIDNVLNEVDAILIRNTGPQSSHRDHLASIRKRTDLCLSNDLRGKGDIDGKGHLLELFELGYPVIPTFASIEAIKGFRSFERYIVKPLNGADSIGVKILTASEINDVLCDNAVIQPLVDFQYEISFYFVSNEFQYALYAPDPKRRWELIPYLASEEDIKFAMKFIEWNTCQHGVQRVDACRLKTGELLLMELEDYNPYLSLESLLPDVKECFVQSLARSFI